MASKKKAVASGAAPPHPDILQVFLADGHVRTLLDIERQLMRLSLVKNRGNMAKAAAELGIARSTLYRHTED
jgi:transcriptional regulator of acetoin/glycerol metabolism